MFKVEVDAREVNAELGKLLREASNLREVNQNIAEILHVMVQDKFEEQGPGWPALADSTLRRRRASRSPRMLQDTGQLVGSFQTDAGDDYAELFTNVEYARYHLNGDGVPKRDFFDIDIEQALKTAEEILLVEIGRGR